MAEDQTAVRKRRRRRRGLGLATGFGVFGAVLAGMLGILSGLGAATFGYADGASYFSNDPKACANCHIMQDHFDSWSRSSHAHVAVCNDCHLPHDFLGKYVTKADNGFFHSLAFTTGDFPDPIRIKPRNARVAQNSCLHCHADFVHSMLPVDESQDMLSCVHCHSSVGHALRHGTGRGPAIRE